MGLVKTRRLAAMQKQQRAKFARYVTYCNMCRNGYNRGGPCSRSSIDTVVYARNSYEEGS